MNASIKRFLFIYLALILVLGYIAIGAISFLVSKEELDELYDANLEEVGITIAAQRLSGVGGVTQFQVLTGPERIVTSEEHFIIRIYGQENLLRYSSHPQFKLQKPPAGFSTQEYQNKQWRSYAVYKSGELIVVTQSLSLRDQAINEVAISLLFPQLIFIPLLGLLLIYTVMRGLKPLHHLSMLIQTRSASDTEPVALDEAPVEIRPVVNALNIYISRAVNTVKVLRQFTSDAAHELRTPLTALKLQLSLLERAQTDSQRHEAAQQMHVGIDRSTKLVQQLLTMAKVEPGSVEMVMKEVNLLEIIKECTEELLPSATVKGIEIGVDSIDSPFIHADTASLRVLIINLLDNAVRYTNVGGTIDFSITSTIKHVILTIKNSGSGIDDRDLERIFDRFFRGKNSISDESGSGLGLAIAKQIVNQHGGIINVSSDPGVGTSFEIIFPLNKK